MTTRLSAGTAGMFVAVVAAVTVSGCSSGNPGDITPAGERVLVPAAQHLREVAATGNWPLLRAAVTAFKDQVEHQQSAGQVSASRAAALEDAADALLTDASPSPSPSPSPTTTSPSPSPSPSPTTVSPTPAPTTAAPTPSVTVTVP